MRKIPNINTHIFKQPGIPWSVEGFSAASLLAFANFDTLGDGLTGDEKTAMSVYIDAEVADGNHAKKDYETVYSLSGANSLVDYIGGKVAVPISSPVHSIDGYAVLWAGGQGIKTNYNPVADGVNYKKDDCLYGVFMFDATVGTSIAYGLYDGTQGSRINWGQGGIRTSITVNSAADIRDTGNIDVQAKSLYLMKRESSSVMKYSINGVHASLSGNPSTAVPNLEFYVPAFNNQGGISYTYNGKITSVLYGGGIGFNDAGHNTNLRALLTSLGLTL